MELYITLYLENETSAIEVGQAFQQNDDELAKECFQTLGITIFSAEYQRLDIESYEKNNNIINVSITSSLSIDEAREALSQLAHCCELLYASINNDGEAAKECYGYDNGKKLAPSRILSKLENKAAVEMLGVAGQVIHAKNREKIDLEYALKKALWKNKKVEVITELLEKGADPNGAEKGEITFLDLAISNRNTKVALALIEHGADLFKWNGDTPLQQAVYMECPKIAEVLLKKYAELNKKIPGKFPMFEAIHSNKPNTVKMLIKYGARRNRPGIMNCVFSSLERCNEAEVKRKISIIKLLISDPQVLDEVIKNKSKYIKLIENNTPHRSSLVEHPIDDLINYVNAL